MDPFWVQTLSSLRSEVVCPHLCSRLTSGPINGGRDGGSQGGKSVDDHEFGSEYAEFEMTIDVQKLLEMQS